jgi:hypothetical protein
LRSLEERELRFLLVESAREFGTPFRLWRDTPTGFTEDVLGETIWSKQSEVLESVWANKRTIVPAGFGVGKTHIAARCVAHFVHVDPVGSSLAVTTATRFRQVRYQLWPHIRKASPAPGSRVRVTRRSTRSRTRTGTTSSSPTGSPRRTTMRPRCRASTLKPLLLVVDEAGGISRLIGGGTNNLLTGDARMLAIGNPAMDDPRSWFEQMSRRATTRRSRPPSPSHPDARLPGHHRGADPHVPGLRAEPRRAHRRPAHARPGLGGPHHPGLRHRQHPYVIAKVFALFPKDAGNQAIPTSWVESAVDREDPEPDDEWVRPCDLGLEGEDATFTVKRGAWVRLGVDVAADGGDEFAIDRSVGDVVHPCTAPVGAQNSSQVDVAEKVLEHIHARRAAREGPRLHPQGPGEGRQERPRTRRVGMLERWAELGRHNAEIVGVMVSESPERDDPGAALRPYRKRDEMWIAMRMLLQPDPSTGLGMVRLRVDHKARIQLSTPQLTQRGWPVGHRVEEVDEARGVGSPTAASPVLAVYEPFPVDAHKRRGLLN